MIYPNTPIPLNHESIFELLIAVLLSAQCTDERVNKVLHLFKLAKRPEEMQGVKREHIYKIIRLVDWLPRNPRR